MKEPYVDHIGIVVEDMERSIAMYERLFDVPLDWSRDRPDRGVRIAMLQTANLTIELLQYTDRRDTAARRTIGTTVGVQHVCFRVGDVPASMARAAAAGVDTIEGFPANGAHGEVAFFMPHQTEGSILEVCRPDDPDIPWPVRTAPPPAGAPYVDHIGILVPDLDASIAMYDRLFDVPLDWRRERDDLGLRIAMLQTGNVTLELLQYTDARDGVPRRTMGGAVGVNHLCFHADDLRGTIDRLAAAGVPLVEGFPTEGAHGEVAFFPPEATDGALIEVCRPFNASP
jgi:methylmalonyl-CoA/ethylmalonyl-CoA epimerase